MPLQFLPVLSLLLLSLHIACLYQLLGDVIIIIIIIIIMLVITFMQGIYNHIPETNLVSSVYSVAAVLYLQSVLHVMLFRPCSMFCTFYISTSHSLCAVPNMAVFAVPKLRAFLICCSGIA